MTCFKCEREMIHPFHDDGTPNVPDMQHFMGIDWFDEERENKERMQDGR